ncbi:MAG: hypothetical protein VKJ46_08195 [Leptolyngbyaceae bacterium]|nr:hypothetical protein [Leptolyngbyaceae bacterium]
MDAQRTLVVTVKDLLTGTVLVNRGAIAKLPVTIFQPEPEKEGDRSHRSDLGKF